LLRTIPLVAMLKNHIEVQFWKTDYNSVVIPIKWTLRMVDWWAAFPIRPKIRFLLSRISSRHRVPETVTTVPRTWTRVWVRQVSPATHKSHKDIRRRLDSRTNYHPVTMVECSRSTMHRT
jgi:hypothetical protein